VKYRQKTFSVPASAGTKDTCDQVGHTEPDIRGKCLRCSAKVRYAITQQGSEALTVPTDSEGAES
jgi:hypothetical protein